MRRSSQGKSSGAGADAGGVGKCDVYGARKTSGSNNLLACYAKTKPRPSKWDDAQKWLSRAGDGGAARRRSSCADDGLLLPPPPPAPTKGAGRWRSWSSVEWEGAPAPEAAAMVAAHGDEGEEEGDTKAVDAVQAYVPQRCVVSLRDVGTEMTPGGSKEPSRANTPRIVAPTAAARRPEGHGVARGTASPGQCEGVGPRDNGHGVVADHGAACESSDGRDEAAGTRTAVSPAMAWGEAERAKYMARYRREEMKIQAWENRERRKAELQMRTAEEKAERMRLRAQARTTRKLATAQAEAKARRTRAEADLALGRPGGKGWLLTRSASWSSGRSLTSSLSLRLPLLCS